MALLVHDRLPMSNSLEFLDESPHFHCPWFRELTRTPQEHTCQLRHDDRQDDLPVETRSYEISTRFPFLICLLSFEREKRPRGLWTTGGFEGKPVARSGQMISGWLYRRRQGGSCSRDDAQT